MKHELKTWPEYFQAVVSGVKTFEVRKNDRQFSPGDVLVLQEYDPRVLNKDSGTSYTGRICEVEVCYFLDNFVGIEPGYCLMAIRLKANK